MAPAAGAVNIGEVMTSTGDICAGRNRLIAASCRGSETRFALVRGNGVFLLAVPVEGRDKGFILQRQNVFHRVATGGTALEPHRGGDRTRGEDGAAFGPVGQLNPFTLTEQQDAVFAR